MSIYHQLKNEVKLKEGQTEYTKKQRVLFEQAIFKDLIAEKNACVKCGRSMSLTLDHVVPIDILKTFGVDTERQVIEGNYRVLCGSCNHFKGNRLDFSTPQTKQILLKLLEKM